MSYTLLIDSRPGGDFSLDLIYAGLVRRLGPNAVIDYPAHEKHRRGKPVLVGDDEKDYGAERSSLGYTPDNHMVLAWDEYPIARALRYGNVGRIFIDERDESYELYLRLKANFFDVPVVVVAGHDRFWNRSPQFVAERFGKNLEAMFIDDWQPEYNELPYTHLINLSINFDHLWERPGRVEKLYDICFMGYQSTGDRGMFLDHIQKKWSHLNNHIVLEKRGNTFDRFVRHQDYFTKMAQSRICINVQGASTSGRALRYYEIPYVGSFMLSQRFPAKLIDPFIGNMHCAYFSTIEELDREIEHALKNPGWREAVAQAGHRYAMTNHTIDARTDHIYRILER